MPFDALLAIGPVLVLAFTAFGVSATLGLVMGRFAQDPRDHEAAVGPGERRQGVDAQLG